MKVIVLIVALLGLATIAAGDWPFIGTISPRHSTEINGSNWSIGAETMDRNYTEYSQWKSYLAPLGVKHARLDGGWARCEPAIGVYAWEWLDEIVFDMVKNQGVKPWIQTSFGNPIYPGGGTPLPGSPIPSTPEALSAWDNWVTALVTRYGEYVDEWEIWNEPDLNIPVSNYTYILIRTATVIKKVQPSAKIFAQFCCVAEYMQQYLEQVSQQGQLSLIDTITYHPYQYNPDTSYWGSGLFTVATDIIHKYSNDIQLYQGENGVPNAPGGYGALTQHNWTDITQTKWTLRRMIGDLVHGTRSSYFSIADMCYSSNLNKKGLLAVNCSDLSVVQVKPAYKSVQYMTSIFDDTIYQTNASAKAPSNYSIHTFRNATSNTDIVALWNGTEIPVDWNTFTNITVSVSGATFNNPVWVDLRVGLIYQIPQTNWNKVNDEDYIFTNIPAYDSVILIADLYALSKWA